MAANVSFHLRSLPDDASVIAALQPLGALPAHLARNQPWTSLFPRLDRRAGASKIESLAREMSAAFRAPVFGFLVERAGFRYWLFDSGRRADAFSSLESGSAGDASLVAALGKPGVTAADVARVLKDRKTRTGRETEEFLREWKDHRRALREMLQKKHAGEEEAAEFLRNFDDMTGRMGDESDVDPSDLAADLAALLGIPDALARLGYEGISGGDGPLGATVRLDGGR